MSKPVPAFIVYGRPYCHLCDDLVAALRAHLGTREHLLRVVDVDDDPALEAQFGEWVPVLFGGGERLCHYHFDALKVDEYLRKTG